MTEKEIQAIVEEVIRRIHHISPEKKTLVLMNSPADEERIDRYLRNSGGIHKIWINSDADFLADGKIQDLADRHKGLLVTGVTLKQLVRIAEMQMEDSLTELVVEILRQGRPVTILSRWIDADCGTPTLRSKIDDLKKTLISYGIAFADWNDLKRDEEGGTFRRIRIDQRVIAKQELKNVLEGELEIREDAVMTTTAKNLIEKRSIKVIRYRN